MRLIAAVATIFTLALAPTVAEAATIAVDTPIDQFENGSGCSVREAIQAANLNADFDACTGTGTVYGDDTVSVPAGTYTLTLIGIDDDNNAWDLDVIGGGALTISGAGTGTGGTIINGNGTSRVFDLRSGALTLDQLKVTGGNEGAGVNVGGGISTEAGTGLTLDGVLVDGNLASSDGGGIYSRGSLAITSGSVISNNTAGGGLALSGGGIAYRGAAPGDSLTISGSSLTGNSVAGPGAQGGGVAIIPQSAGQSLSISSSELSANGILGAQLGGAVYMEGASAADTLSISDSRLAGNRVFRSSPGDAQGGGLYLRTGSLELASSEVAENEAEHTGDFGQAWGAGLYLQGDTTTTDTVIADNEASASGDDTSSAAGGGVYFRGGASIVRRSTVSGNTVSGAVSAQGGGIEQQASGSLTVVNSTISGNSASSPAAALGGGIEADSVTTSLIQTTVADNTSDGNADAVSSVFADSFTVRGSVLDGPDPSTVCFGNPSSGGHNVARGLSCGLGGTGDVQNVDPELLTLADNGGPDVGAPGQVRPLLTHALAATSAAVDKVPAASCDDENPPNDLLADERGFPRPFPAACDAGSYELVTCGAAVADGSTILGTSAGELISGTAGPDVILGLGGGDTITGAGGDDTLCGGGGDDNFVEGAAPSGADELHGDAGSDRVNYSLRSNPIVADIDGAADDGEACPGASCENDELSADVEEIEGGSAADVLTGDEDANGLIGNDGNDLLVGLEGADALLGLGDTDAAGYEERLAAEGVTATLGTVSGNGNADDGLGDNLANGVENLIGGAGDDVLTGNGVVNALSGGAGADVLDGRDLGDSLDGGAAADTVLYSSGGGVSVNLATGSATGAQGADTLSLIENAVGSPGSDLLVSGPGDNSLDGGAGNDTASFGLSSQPVVASLVSGIATGDAPTADALAGVENLEGTDFGDTLTGNGDANALSGGDGNDTLTGNAGADRARARHRQRHRQRSGRGLGHDRLRRRRQRQRHVRRDARRDLHLLPERRRRRARRPGRPLPDPVRHASKRLPGPGRHAPCGEDLQEGLQAEEGQVREEEAQEAPALRRSPLTL